jgi:hypothetical protein
MQVQQVLCLVVVLAIFTVATVQGCGNSGDKMGTTGTTTSSSTTGTGGSLAFLAACDPTNNQCMSQYVCFNFPAFGNFCTKTCNSGADCPSPSPGCNGMGYCKPTQAAATALEQVQPLPSIDLAD